MPSSNENDILPPLMEVVDNDAQEEDEMDDLEDDDEIEDAFMDPVDTSASPPNAGSEDNNSTGASATPVSNSGSVGVSRAVLVEDARAKSSSTTICRKPFARAAARAAVGSSCRRNAMAVPSGDQA